MEKYKFPLKADGMPDFSKIREDLGVVFTGLEVAYQDESKNPDAERLYNMAKERLIILTEGIAKNPPWKSEKSK